VAKGGCALGRGRQQLALPGQGYEDDESRVPWKGPDVLAADQVPNRGRLAARPSGQYLALCSQGHAVNQPGVGEAPLELRLIGGR
jgi:hypothetical protein